MALPAAVREAAWWLAVACLGALTITSALHLATVRRIESQLLAHTETVETLSYAVKGLETHVETLGYAVKGLATPVALPQGPPAPAAH